MMKQGQRRIYRRPYFFELFTILNLAIIVVLVAQPMVLTSIPYTFASFFVTFGAYTLAGVVLRAIVAAVRKTLPAYLRKIRSAGWISDTIRLIFFAAAMSHTYFWIKLMVPLLNPALYDQQLWDLDQKMLFGFSPNILFLSIFSAPTVLKAIDWSYANIFFASMTVAFIFFLSAPVRRLRIAFATGNTLMWIIGAWLYLAIPSVGPAYRFPDVWMPLAASLEVTQNFQALLMKNYRQVLLMPSGQAKSVMVMFGIGAFPSLHVAFQVYAFLWMRRLWIYGQIVFGVFLFVILIGSVVTGWHYLIDGFAGMVLAAACYWIPARTWRIREWLRLWRAVNSPR